MPFRLAASDRGRPSSTSASAKIRRTCGPSLHLADAARSSAAVKSSRVTLTAVPIPKPPNRDPRDRIRLSAGWESPESQTLPGWVLKTQLDAQQQLEADRVLNETKNVKAALYAELYT